MKYTELLTEFVKSHGGAEQAFPALFYAVPDIVVNKGAATETTITFSDTFLLNFCDREIGFEIEELFALKLEAYARRYIPSLITAVNEIAKINPNDTGGTLQSQFVYPETGSTDTVAKPDALREQTSVTTEESAIEQADTAENLARRVRDLWEETFAKFEPLFMQVY